LIAGEQTTASELQRFRDTKLLSTGKGTSYLSEFNSYSSEAVEMVLKDSALRTKARDAINNFLPFITAYMNQTDLRFTVFSSTMYTQAEEVINLIKFKASAGLASDLENFRVELVAQVGKTYQEAIDTLLGITPPPDCCYEPPPPTPPPPDEPPTFLLSESRSDELNAIVGADATVQSRLQAFFDPRHPIIDDWLRGGTQASQAIFTSSEYNELAGIIDQMRAQASPDLAADFDRLKAYLQSRINFTYEQVLKELFGVP